jgi:hypothetical protein
MALVATSLALWIGCSDSAPQAPDEEVQAFELAIAKREVAVADDVLRVRQGQRVKLRWQTDEAATIHLHGYDLRAALKPGTPVVWDFEATATGRFPIEAHGFGDPEEAAPEHDHPPGSDPSTPHDHPAEESASSAPPGDTTLVYFEVHPR